MSRGVYLLLLLFGAWLCALPAARTVPVPTPQAALAGHAEATPNAEHVAAQVATPVVAPAPFLDRLPATDVRFFGASRSFAIAQAARVRDLRALLRRAQVRRRLPRLSGDEPPWL